MQRAVFVGELTHGSTGRQRFRALTELGFDVAAIESATRDLDPATRFLERAANRLFQWRVPMVSLPDFAGTSHQLPEAVGATQPALLWLDKAMRISARALENARRECPSMRIVGFSPDNMIERHNQSRQFLETLPLCNLFATTKSFAVTKLREMGCAQVMFVDNSFDLHTHRPPESISAEFISLRGRVGFIGTWEEERSRSIRRLCAGGVPVTVFGSGWKRRPLDAPGLDLRYVPLYGDRYAQAISSFAINLCFLRKMNGDMQTTRSVEIPACGSFMLAERTDEHMALFEEGVEAEFFSSDEEMLDKARYYLEDEERRRRIALAGRQRCLKSGYSYHHRIRAILSTAGFDNFARIPQ